MIRLSRDCDFVAVPDVLVKVHVHQGPKLTAYDKGMAEAYERIMELHSDAIASDKTTLAAYHYKMGWLQYHSGNKRAARRHCLSVLRMRPTHAKTWVIMGMFELLGQRLAGRLHRSVSYLWQKRRKG